jgi:hypothetical protein
MNGDGGHELTTGSSMASPDVTARHLGWSRADTVVNIALSVGAALICMAAILRRPDINAASTFLFADPGVNLLIAEKLSHGGRLYRDVGYSYGPLAVYPYVWTSRAIGNTPQAFSGFLAFFSVLSVALSYLLMRRHVARWAAALMTVVALYPMLLIPGSLIFGIQASAYIVIERILLLAVLFSWRPPEVRERRHYLAIGLLLGMWQGVRFGTAIFVGAAVILIDVLAMVSVGANRAAALRWFRLSLTTLGGFLAVEVVWVIGAFALLPASDARDFLWPSFALEAFRVWPRDYRWPRYLDIRAFIGQQLLPLACLVAGMVVLAAAIARRAGTSRTGRRLARWRVAPGDYALLLPFVFYVIGAAGLFRSVFHFHQYTWALAFVAALAIDRGGRRAAAVFSVVALPALLLMLRANLVTRPAADSVVIRPPLGGALLVTPAQKRMIDMLEAHATTPEPRTLIIMHVGAGFHALFKLPDPGRQLFYILGFARGDDENSMLRTLDSGAAAMVLTDYPAGAAPTGDPCTWYGWQHFAADFCPRLAQRVDIDQAVRIDETTWLIPAATARSRGVRATDRAP